MQSGRERATSGRPTPRAKRSAGRSSLEQTGSARIGWRDATAKPGPRRRFLAFGRLCESLPMVAVAAQIVNLAPQAVPVRLNLGEELAQALDLRLQYWDLRRFVGRGSRHVHGCAAIPGNVRPPPLGGRLRRLGRLRSSDWPSIHQTCAPLRVTVATADCSRSDRLRNWGKQSRRASPPWRLRIWRILTPQGQPQRTAERLEAAAAARTAVVV